MVTDQDGIAESELLPIGRYEDGAYQEEIVYVLKETEAKEGYQKSEEEWEIIFEYKDDQIPVIEVLKEIQNTKESDTGTSGKVPQTGDRIRWIVPVTGIFAGALCLFWMVVRMKRRNKRRKGKGGRRRRR